MKANPIRSDHHQIFSLQKERLQTVKMFNLQKKILQKQKEEANKKRKKKERRKKKNSFSDSLYLTILILKKNAH